MKKITKEMIDNYTPNGNRYGLYKTYCELHDSCKECNYKVRILCKIRNVLINRIQEKIIKKEVMKNER